MRGNIDQMGFENAIASNVNTIRFQNLLRGSPEDTHVTATTISVNMKTGGMIIFISHLTKKLTVSIGVKVMYMDFDKS